MKKNIVIGILLLLLGAAAFGVASWLGLYEAPQTEKSFIKAFKNNIKKDMKFIPLDYMNEEQIESCKNLHDILKKDYKKLEVVSKKAVEGPVSFDVFCGNENAEGVPEFYHFDMMPEYFYRLDNGYVFVTYINDMINLKFLDNETCQISNNKNMLVSDNYAVVKIDNKYYVVAEWFDGDKYVFYYVDGDPSLDEVNCRFNLVN